MLEVERKYDADDALVVPDLTAVAGVASVSDPAEQVLDATYFDSDDHRLIGWGVTVRRRVGGSDEGWHLKLPSAEDDDRHELRLPLSRAKHTVPRHFRTVVSALVGDAGLVPVARLVTRRTVRELRDASGRLLAEVVDDRVEAHAAGAGPEAPATWREVEIELVESDDDTLLAAIGERLEEAGARTSERRAKLEVVLPRPDQVAPLEPTQRRDRVGQLLHARLAAQLHQMLLRDPLARENLPGGVHTMRVAVRRLRSALATGRPFLDRTVSEPLRAELSWLSDVLGDARDAEMQRDRLEHAIDALVEERSDLDWSPDLVRPELLDPLVARHGEAVATLRDVLSGDRYGALLDRLRAFVLDPPWTAKADKRIRGAYRRRLGHDLRRLASRIEAAQDHELDHDERGAALHAARRAVKRARYAAEPLRPVYGDPAERLVACLKDLQTGLGQYQDTVVTRQYLHHLTHAGDDTLDPVAALVAGALVERESRDAEGYEEEAAAAWRTVLGATSVLS